MTSKVDRYNNNTVLGDMKGESLQDLYDNVKVYLETLIEKINLHQLNSVSAVSRGIC